MGNKKTHEQFCKEVYNLIKDEYEVMGEYKGALTKIKIKHKVCNTEWNIKPNDFLQGKRCPHCAGLFRRNTEQYKSDVFQKYGDEYSVLGEFKNVYTKIEVQHNTCGTKWYVRAGSFLKGHKCPNCYGTFKKTTEQFKKEMKLIHGDEYQLIGEYITRRKFIKILHTSCNTSWDTKPNNILSGSGCPLCLQSKGEKFIKKLLDNNRIKYIIEKRFKDCRYKYPLPFDFYLPDLNICIEYDGIQHYEVVDFGSKNYIKTLKRFVEILIKDKIKDEYCINNNIKLIRIPYWDFNKIEDILKNIFSDIKGE